jgi:phenylalanyl-tRNA synthetase beta chain
LLAIVAEQNSRFFEAVNIFEIGKVFAWQGKEAKEKLVLGLAVGGKKKKDSILLVKGAMDSILRSAGITDFSFETERDHLYVKVGSRVVGFLRDLENFGKAKGWVFAVGELDLTQIISMSEEEFVYKPIPKYPAVMRDISMVVDGSTRIGDIVEEISSANEKLIVDVDLMDEYWDEKFGSKQSLTFRVVFQADDHTLTDNEVNLEMENIVSILKTKFESEIR